MSKHAPSFRAPQREHSRYGIDKWFILKYNIKDKEVRQVFIDTFCEKNNFQHKGKGGTVSRQLTFCSNRFQAFAIFVGDEIKIIKQTNPELI